MKVSASTSRMRSDLFYWFASSALIAAIAYLTYATVQGENGLLRSTEAAALEKELVESLADLRSRREDISSSVSLISEPLLDTDFLEERAREVLVLNRKDEMVID